MDRINFKHSVIFFNLCILISPLYLMLNFEPIIEVVSVNPNQLIYNGEPGRDNEQGTLRVQ